MELLSHGYGNLKNAMNTSFNINFIHMAYILVIWERGN